MGKEDSVRYVNKQKARSLSTTYGSPLASVVQKAGRGNSNTLTEDDFVNDSTYHKVFDTPQAESLQKDLEAHAEAFSKLKSPDEMAEFIRKHSENRT